MSELTEDLQVIAGQGDWVGSTLMDELEVTITRQSVMPAMKLGTSGGGGENPILFHLAGSDAKSDLQVTMRKVRALVTEEYPHLNCVSSHPTDVARWLLLFPELLRAHPKIEWISNAVHLAVYTALNAIDSPPERALLGFCESCGRALWVIMESGDTFDERLVECCSTSSTVRELRTRLRERLSRSVVTPEEQMGLVFAFTGEAVSNPESFKRKIRRKLTAVTPGRYLASEVLELVAPEQWKKYVSETTHS